MKTLYDAAMMICRIRDALDPIVSGEIRRGHACKAMGDLTLEPGLRKATLKDARSICHYQKAKLNEVANLLIELDREENTPCKPE